MRVLLSAIMFVSVSAFAACPNLTGSFKICTPNPDDGTGSTDMVVAQSFKNGVTTYSFTSTDSQSHARSTETYIADGRVRTTTQNDADTGITFVTNASASCDANNTLVGSLKVTANGEDFANVTMTASKVGQRMVTVTAGTMMGQDMSQTTICE